MVRSLWITYILFAEKFEAKINIFRLKTFIIFMVNFRENCACILDLNY